MVNSGNHEKRKYARLSRKCILKCEEFTAKSFREAPAKEEIEFMTKDIGSGGISFESKIKFEPGVLLKLEIKAPGWEKFKNEFFQQDKTTRSLPLIVLAKVVRVKVVQPDKIFEIGVCFCAIDEGHKSAFSTYIDRQIHLNQQLPLSVKSKAHE